MMPPCGGHAEWCHRRGAACPRCGPPRQALFLPVSGSGSLHVGHALATELEAIPGLAALGVIWRGPKDLPQLSPVVSCDSPLHCECASQEACPNPWAFFVFGLLCGSDGLIAAWIGLPLDMRGPSGISPG